MSHRRFAVGAVAVIAVISVLAGGLFQSAAANPGKGGKSPSAPAKPGKGGKSPSAPAKPGKSGKPPSAPAKPGKGRKSGKTECNTTFSNVKFHGGVVVKSGDTCTLSHVVIDGGLTVTGGQFSVQNSRINGGWTITGGTGLGLGDQCGNNVNGGLRLANTQMGTFVFGEADRSCAGGRVNGGVRFVNNSNSSIVELDSYRVNGGIVDTGNTGTFNEIEGDNVHGGATCVNNNVPASRDFDGGPNHYTGKNSGCPL